MTHRKKLIEVALPLEAINEASAREKSIRHGHPSTLHLWWARRPLAAARAVIFASLVDDPDSPDALPAFVEACRQLPVGANVKANGDTPRMRLFDFIERLVTWEATTDEAILNTARALIRIATEGNPPPLLDPFAGGGSIPLEAQRLGLEAHASDLNPVAVMINKAQIEIPPRFANMPPVNPRDGRGMMHHAPATHHAPTDTTWRGAAGLAADVRYYGEWMRERAWERIGHLYPTHNSETVIAWLWARTVKCPNPACGIEMPLLTSFVLSTKAGREHYLVPRIDGNKVRFEISATPPPNYKDPKKGLKRGMSGIFECVNCGTVTERDYVASEGISKRIGSVPTAIVLEGIKGREYVEVRGNPVPGDLPEVNTAGLLGEFPPNPRDLWCRNFGLTTPADLFTPRQLVALTTFSDLVHEAREQAHADARAAGLPDDGIPLRDGGRGALAYGEAVSVYLGFGVSRGSDINNALCRWEMSKTQVRNLFGRQAIPMVWDFAENNVFNHAAGDYLTSLESIIRVIERSLGQGHDGVVLQIDATHLDRDNGTVLSTDPPYYDNIGYADLSDFFYVWMRKSLRDVYPDVFGTMLVPKEPELIASPYRHGGKEAANEHFESGMFAAFSNIRRFISHDYPLTVYYAFKQQDAEAVEEDGDDNGRGMMHHAPTSTGWETMLTSLIDSGFSIDGTWPMRTELSNRMIGSGTNALASSIVLVCRPRPQDAPSTSRRAFLDDLRRELPAAIKAMQTGSIAPVDLAQASIGPGMAIYSRYSKVLEADGTPMSVRTALGLINAALDEYLAEQDGDIDADTRFAVSWFEQFGFGAGEFGQADVLARAKNTSVAGVESAGLVLSGRGKVRLRHWSEYDPGAWDPRQDERPTVWEATHHLIERLNNHGETGSALLMQKMPSDMAAEARQLAYRLYSICERNGWADHARDYNALVMSWSGIGEEAARLREQQAAGDATVQTSFLDM
jgi:putative DNA methylase